jgi:hypothetical protein
MANVGEVRAAIAQAVEKAGQSAAALQQAAQLAEDAQALLSTAVQGSTQSDTDQATAQFGKVIEGVNDLQKTLGAGISQAEGIGGRL